MATMEQMQEKAASPRKVEQLEVKLPLRNKHVFAPLITTVAVAALDFCVAFIDLVSKGSEAQASELKRSSGVLSTSVIQFHMTWGLMLTATLSFVENSLKFTLNRRKCHVFGSLNALVCFAFVLACIYTWLWTNDAAGMTYVCKYFLVSVSVRQSPEQIKLIAYTADIKYYVDLAVSWLLPIQCAIVLADSVLSLCNCYKTKTGLPFCVSTQNNRLICKVDYHNLKNQINFK